MRNDDLFYVEYGYWFNLTNERFYSHLDTVLNLVQLVGGSAAALSVLQKDPAILIFAGIALAVCAALSLVVQPGIKAERHRACKAQWRSIKGQAGQMPDVDLHRTITELQGTGPSGMDTLAMPAFNATLRATGREDAQRGLSVLQRLASMAA